MRQSRDQVASDRDDYDEEAALSQAQRRDRQMLATAALGACSAVALAVVALLTVVALPAAPARSEVDRAGPAWDGLDSHAAQSLIVLEPGARRPRSAPVMRDPVAEVQTTGRRYAVDRSQQIRSEIARIDADPYRTQKDLERRRLLAGELSRLAER